MMWQKWIEDLEAVAWEIDFSANDYFLQRQFESRGRAMVALAKRNANLKRLSYSLRQRIAECEHIIDREYLQYE